MATHRGENGARDSTIDLVWANQAADMNGTFGVREVSWDDSYVLDHALIRIRATSTQKARQLPMDRATGFQTTASPNVGGLVCHTRGSSANGTPLLPFVYRH